MVNSTKTELLLGCGNSKKKFLSQEDINGLDIGPLENPITLDLDPHCNPDVLHDLNVLPYPFPDQKFDEIWASHILEHCGQQGDWRFFFAQWNEFYRIMKPNGLFFSVVPAPNTCWVWGDPGHTRVIQPETLYFLDQDVYSQKVGYSTMTDYRHVYHGNFKVLDYRIFDVDLLFILERSSD